MEQDTIAAVATGMADAGISIVRISGSEAFHIAEQLFVPKKHGERKLSEWASHTMHYGTICQGDTVFDEVLLSVMRAPNTYTKEDVVEINCHGGVFVTKKVLELVLCHGARLAEPGEFTKRAFLNGRIDLSQAEAVIDLIHAANEQALKNSVRQLGGSLHQKISKLRESILRDTAWMEAALDDPEHISMDGFSETLKEHTKCNMAQLERLLGNVADGKIIKEGIRTVILGKPNAGKSTLLNALVGEERAIVTEIPGTTRDTLEELIKLKGAMLRVIDTAGIRDTFDAVEKIGVKKAKEAAEDADLLIYVADATTPLDENDEAVIAMLTGRKAVVLLNKSDLPMEVTAEELAEKTGRQVLLISAKKEQGIGQLAEAIEQMFYQGLSAKKEEEFITNLRHERALSKARESLSQVLASIENGMPEDFYSIDLMNAYQVLGEMIGEAVDEDLVDTVFREFCMGK